MKRLFFFPLVALSILTPLAHGQGVLKRFGADGPISNRFGGVENQDQTIIINGQPYRMQRGQDVVVHPRSGVAFPKARGGVINPETGEFYPRVRGGYINPDTGDFLPE